MLRAPEKTAETDVKTIRSGVAVGRQASAEAEKLPADDPILRAISQWQRERPDLDPLPMAIFGRIARVFTLQRMAQAGVHQPLGLSHAAFDVLANLRRSGPPHRVSASKLASSSMISTGSVTFRMDGLETAGLIRRVRDEGDRRVVHAELTDEGRAVIDRAIEAHLAAEHAMLAKLTDSEQQDLARLLAKLESSIAGNTAARGEAPQRRPSP